ncbi:MAG: hypothetical protein Kow0063_32030 [Anaerolineae bacterium]
MGLGVPLGLVFDNLALGIAIGAAIGSAIGISMEQKRKGMEAGINGKQRVLVTGIGILLLLIGIAAFVFLLLWPRG